MNVATVVERVQHVAAVRGDDGAGRAELEAALRTVGQLQSWLTGTKAALTTKLAAQVSFPEQTLAECTRDTTRNAVKDTERADTLDRSPVARLSTRRGGGDHRPRRRGHPGDQTPRQRPARRAPRPARPRPARHRRRRHDRRLAQASQPEIKNIQRDDGMARLERQRRATRLRTWTDADGMWCLSGRFDPVTGVQLAARLDTTIDALFAETTPDTCPTDPVEKQHHLRGLALAALVDGTGVGTRPGRPEYVVVIDTTQPDGNNGPTVDWGLPVEIPHRVLADLIGDGQVHPVVVRNGVVLHAPGNLDLARTTRLANRAQRRALRGLYATCAIPGCTVHYDRCKLHHITWWRHGGHTNLDNLIPVCARHHTKIHHDGWHITLGPNRELTIRFPDGTIRCTGPPNRRAA
jgi:hypothetical protein